MAITKDAQIRILEAENRALKKATVNNRRQIRAIEHDIHKMVKENPENAELKKARDNIRDFMKEINLLDQRTIRKQYEDIHG